MRPVPADADVRELIRSRLTSGRREDGARLAIVLEGGGMRGVLSAASASVIHELGILDAADLIVGTSAGATNAVAAAAGVVGELTDAYAAVFAHPDFVDPRRMLMGRPAIASERILAEVEARFQLAGQARRRPIDLAMVATDVAAAEPVALTGFEEDADVLRAVAASSRLPLLGGAPVEFRGRRWLDGGVSEAVATQSAARLGATHALVVTTRPLTSSPAYGPADRAVELYLRRLNPTLARQYAERPVRYKQLMAELRSGRTSGMRTLSIAPAESDPIPSRMERDQGLLREAASAARQRALDALAG